LTVASTGPLLLEVRHQHGNRLLHHARRLHHLRQKHLAGAEQVADHVHAVHQRALDDRKRTIELEARRLRILGYEPVESLDQRVLEPLRDRP
jgi:hypothetical protein